MTKQTTIKYRVTVALLATISAVAIWLTGILIVTPPAFLANQKHVDAQILAFEEIAAFFDREREVETLALRPDNVVSIVVDRQGQSIRVSEQTMKLLVDLLSKTKVGEVSRRQNRLEYFAGSEVKFGRQFQARVIRANDIGASLRSGVIRRCSFLFGFFKASGECLDVLNSNFAIHYLWLSD